MKPIDQTILLTGATGGLGRCLVKELATNRVRLALSGRNAVRLERLCEDVESQGGSAVAFPMDLSRPEAASELAADVVARVGVPDLLINNAGVNAFRSFELETALQAETLFRTNVLAPMELTRGLLPGLLERGSGRIVNVGSIFGSIAFAWFATYSASKFALRGWSEALRRELSGSGVEVTYVAPRAIRTPMTEAYQSLADATGMNVDEPELVAAKIVQAIRGGVKDRYLGWPEKLFVRMNALLPRLVDRSLRKQNETARTLVRADDLFSVSPNQNARAV